MSNNRSERRIRNNKIRRQKQLRRNFFTAIATFGLIITLSVSVGGFLSKAKDDSESMYYKYYKSITVSTEDTLWSIAQEYMDATHYQSVDDYIKEVKQMNHLQSDTITYGCHLVIPYYTDEYTG
ncbi:MAG: LysM peptidoglycan-binding domain-containing protein [Bacillus sp. (in: Bacteria)]|nr:LysM peptidoglycan-binding domain-containing protein [Bacillus sp. (in: firmicutes)]MCM1425886.1 LysM peptidoglycan-binding domain-containing protein [Eubacterium sp.]